MTPFASLAELELYWKDIPEADHARANNLLDLASNRLRLIAQGVSVDIDTNALTDPYKSVARWVVMEAVKRAMSTPTDQPPVESWSQTAGPYSENYKYSNPSGDLWFRTSELSALGLGGNQVLGSISTSRTDYYSS